MPPVSNNLKLQRLNKAIAQTGYCSRRKADDLIFQGRVKVNGEIVGDPAARIKPDDQLKVDDQPLAANSEYTYIIINKPVQVITSCHDPRHRKIILDFLPKNMRNIGLVPVGRLDYFSEGLLLLTNDGELSHRLMHPSFQQKKTYKVTIRGFVKDDILNKISNGLLLENAIQLAPIKVKIVERNNSQTILELILTQGINREIRRICDQFGLVILKLKRVSQGVLALGALPSGQFRKLANKEIEDLRQSVNLSIR